jgi:hypothetical protein
MVRRGITLACLLLVPVLSAAAPGAAPITGVPAACDGIPEGESLMPGLVSGQVLRGNGVATLRFANQAFACNDWPNSVSDASCDTQWTFRVSLPGEELTPGSYDLVQLGADFGYLLSKGTPQSGGGCSEQQCKTSVYGVGSAEPTAGATLDIYSVSDGCITGALSGFTPLGESAMPMPDVNGAFFALPCAE